jgi:glycosyltransferase involved in cell wall biosynthesis
MLNGLSRSSEDLLQALIGDAKSNVTFHAHGLWLMPNVYPAWVKKKARGRVTLVHSIRGMLSKKAREISAWKKAPFWHVYQRAALEQADCLHATAFSELQDIRNARLKNPVAVIPNGVELPSFEHRNLKRFGDEQLALSIGRLHPIKGFDRLIRAWVAVEGQFPNWRLMIAGPAEDGYDETLRDLCRSLGALRIKIEGPVYGDKKTAAYQSADLFVLASRSENFGLALAEGLAAGVPAIATKGSPWQGLNTHSCGWWIDDDVEVLASSLSTAMSLTNEERNAMGARAREWVTEAFSWPQIAHQFRDVYRWLHYGGTPPDVVVLD